MAPRRTLPLHVRSPPQSCRDPGSRASLAIYPRSRARPSRPVECHGKVLTSALPIRWTRPIGPALLNIVTVSIGVVGTTLIRGTQQRRRVDDASRYGVKCGGDIGRAVDRSQPRQRPPTPHSPVAAMAAGSLDRRSGRRPARVEPSDNVKISTTLGFRSPSAGQRSGVARQV